MKTDNITQITDQQTITSMEIAEITGKNHYDVMKAIRKMEPAWQEVHKSKFSLLFRISKLGNNATKKNPYYSLTKTECLFVATKFNDVARAKLVLRWEQLEKERLVQQPATQPQPKPETVSSVPVDPRNMSRLQILQLALQAEEENERLRKEGDDLRAENMGLLIDNGQKDITIRELNDKVAYMHMVDQAEDTLNTTQIAQAYGMSAIAFNNLLKGLRIQYNSGGQWILYADYINRGYTANRQVEICHSNQRRSYKQLTVWTRAGAHFLYDRLKKNGILPLAERQQAPAAKKTQ